jgi:four helix bundle protein
MKLVVAIYDLTKNFPREETYGLSSQLRRAAVSIPANIAEGQGRRLPREFTQFLANARGSLLEVDTLLELAKDLGYISRAQHVAIQQQVDEVGRMLNGLLKSIKV